MPIFLNVKSCSTYIPVRVIVLISVSLLNFIMEMEKWLTNTAIQEMTYSADEIDNYSISQCPYMMDDDWILEITPEPGTYLYWDMNVGVALRRGFYLGNLLTQIPGGIIADLYGSRRLIITALIFFGCLSLLQPLVASLGQYYFMLVRLMIGMSQGFLLSSPFSVLAHWAPISERSRFVAFPAVGNFGGFLVAFLVMRYAPGEWATKLYTPGICSLLLAVFWYLLTYSEPASCPYISEGERDHITLNIEGVTTQDSGTTLYPFVPWRRMMISPPLLCLLLYFIGYYWMIDTIWQQHFFYMTSILHMTNKMFSLSVLVSYMGEMFSTLIWGSASDWLINNGLMSRTINRKLFGLAAVTLVIPQVFLTHTFGCNSLHVAMVYVSVYFSRALAAASIEANPIDLSPRYAGVIFSIIISSNSIAALIGSIVTDEICEEVSDRRCWLKMNGLMAVVVAVCSLPFLWFGTAKVQTWNNGVTLPQDPDNT